MCIRDSPCKNRGKETRETIKPCLNFKYNDCYILLLQLYNCLLYTSDAADERSSVDLGGRRIIKKKKIINIDEEHLKRTTSDKETYSTDARIYKHVCNIVKRERGLEIEEREKDANNT